MCASPRFTRGTKIAATAASRVQSVAGRPVRAPHRFGRRRPAPPQPDRQSVSRSVGQSVSRPGGRGGRRREPRPSGTVRRTGSATRGGRRHHPTRRHRDAAGRRPTTCISYDVHDPRRHPAIEPPGAAGWVNHSRRVEHSAHVCLREPDPVAVGVGHLDVPAPGHVVGHHVEVLRERVDRLDPDVQQARARCIPRVPRQMDDGIVASDADIRRKVGSESMLEDLLETELAIPLDRDGGVDDPQNRTDRCCHDVSRRRVPVRAPAWRDPRRPRRRSP